MSIIVPTKGGTSPHAGPGSVRGSGLSNNGKLSFKSILSSRSGTSARFSEASGPAFSPRDAELQPRRKSLNSWGPLAPWRVPDLSDLMSYSANSEAISSASSSSGSALAAVPAWLEFISLGDNDELLRGTPLSKVLQGAAGILSQSHGNEDTYALSQPVNSIGFFVSHNWSVGRFQKFLALSLYFNFRLAAVTSTVVQFALAVLTWHGFLPSVHATWANYPRGMACRVLGIPIFLVMLLSGGELRHLLRLGGPMVFLDKTCISQTNKEMQKRGIRRLGAFLCKSNCMLVLYTDIYLTKLWTVYEFACFLTLHTIKHISLVPTFLPKAIFLELAMIFLGNLFAVLAEASGRDFPTGVASMALLAACPMLATVFRSEARKRSAMVQRFSDFSVDGCTCSNEEDRPLVYHNIAELMEAAEVVAPGTTQKEALEAFNVLARTKLPGLVEQAMGKYGHRYHHLATLSTLLIGSNWLDVMVGTAHGMPWKEALVYTATQWTLMLATGPLGLAAMSKLTRCFLRLRGLGEYCVAVIVGWLCAAFAMLVAYGHHELWNSFIATGRMDIFAWLNVAVLVLCILGALRIFGCLKGQVKRALGRRGSGLVSSVTSKRSTYKEQLSQQSIQAEEGQEGFSHPSDWEDPTPTDLVERALSSTTCPQRPRQFQAHPAPSPL